MLIREISIAFYSPLLFLKLDTTAEASVSFDRNYIAKFKCINQYFGGSRNMN